MNFDYEDTKDIVSDAVYMALGANSLKHGLDRRRSNRALKRVVTYEVGEALAKGEAYQLDLNKLLGLGTGDK